MPIDEVSLRQEMCRWGCSMFERGLTAGSSGNFSARLDDGYLVTPTGSCLGFLDPARLSKLDPAGVPLSGDAPTKEWPLHLAIYDVRPSARGIVHLHSTYATALSCLEATDPVNVLLPVTPYASMQLGHVALTGYAPPGSSDLAALVRADAASHAAILMANHGPVVSAGSFQAAVFAAEELEETAKLMLILRDRQARLLPATEIERLNRPHSSKSP